MYDKESIAKEKCKSRLFKGIAGWCARHGAVLAAFMLIAVSAVLGTFETKLVYGGSLSYGQNGTTSSPTYKGGNPRVVALGFLSVFREAVIYFGTTCPEVDDALTVTNFGGVL